MATFNIRIFCFAWQLSGDLNVEKPWNINYYYFYNPSGCPSKRSIFIHIYIIAFSLSHDFLMHSFKKRSFLNTDVLDENEVLMDP